MKMKIAGLLVVTLLIITVVIPLVSSENIVEKSVEDEKEFDNTKTGRGVNPSALPPWLLKIFNGDWNYWTNLPNMYSIPEGNVGIGTNTPSEKLDVVGIIKMEGFKMLTGAIQGYVLTSDSTGEGTWQPMSGGDCVTGSGTANYLPKFSGAKTIEDSIIYEDNGKVGVNTESPSTEFEVDGTVTASSFVGDGSGLTNISFSVGYVPIGSIISWAKDIPGVPSLSDNFVECNGQTLDDPESPLHGQVIPDLNGENRFLRGDSTSGGTGGKSTVTLTVSQIPSHSHDVYLWGSGGGGNFVGQGTNPYVGTKPTATTGGGQSHENKPPFYNVVFIMRIK